MTNTTQTPTPNTGTTTQPTTPQGGAFTSIPTRIRDVRSAQGVPPLVVEPSDNAAEVNTALMELSSRMAEIHRTTAEAYMSQGNFEGAVPHLEAAVLMQPTDPECQHQLGFVRYLTGDDVGAVNAFNAVLAKDPTNGEAWFNLGMVMFGQEQHAEADICFQKAIETDPTDAQTWNNRGVCCFKLGRVEDAKACFTRALQIDPTDEDAQFNLTNMS